MQLVQLGRRGPRVAPVALGLWQAGGRLWGRVDTGELREALKLAVENGLTLFDTAELYGLGESEKLLGQILYELGARDEAFIVTKIAGYRVTVHGALKAVEASSRRLGRKPDMVLYHWPPPYPFTVCRAARILEAVVEKGVASWVGVSNFNTRQLTSIVYCMKKTEILVDQVQYSLAYRTPENSLIPAAKRLGVTVMAWAPLAKGALAGRTHADNIVRRIDKVFTRAAQDTRLQHALETAATRLGASRAAIALAWLKTRNTIPVVGVKRREHVESAIEALKLELPEHTVKELDTASENYVSAWGREYNVLQSTRYIPPPLQQLVYNIILRGI